MPTYPISSTPANVSQSITQDALIQNIGSETVYLDTESSVTSVSYGTALPANSTINWPANTVLWAVTATGKTSKLAILYNASGAAIGSITGDVTANITGGTITVDDITGPVSVSGSTVNIGNEVRLVGGGDRVSNTTVAPSETFTMASIMGASYVTRKYNSFRLVLNFNNLIVNGTIYLIVNPASENIYSIPFSYNPSLAANYVSIAPDNKIVIQGPMISDPSLMIIGFGGFVAAAVNSIDLYMDYTARTDFTLAVQQPSPVFASVNFASLGTVSPIIVFPMRPYAQKATFYSNGATTGITGSGLLYINAYDGIQNVPYRLRSTPNPVASGDSLTLDIPPYSYCRYNVNNTGAKTGLWDVSVYPAT